MHAAEPPPDTRHLVWMRRVSFAVLVAVVAVHGIRVAAIPESEQRGAGAFLAPLLIAFATATWCLFDGRVRGKPPAPVGLMGIVLVPPIGLLAYCIWSRGVRGLLFALGLVCLLLSVLVTAGVLTVYVLDARL